MDKIVPLARSRYGSAKADEANDATYDAVMARFPDRVRHVASNLAAHSHDITLVGDRLLISCAWYYDKKYAGTGWWSATGQWAGLTEEEFDKLYPETTGTGSKQTGVNRTYNIQTDWLQ